MPSEQHQSSPGARALTHDIVVVGASAGGVEALIEFCGRLPRHLAAAVFVVLHIPPKAPSYLPMILSRAGPLPAKTAEDGEPIRRGQIYIAPPDHHLLLVLGSMRVSHGPRENRSRPAIDPLFRTAAVAYGPRVIGVILSGALNDGTSGLLAVKQQGGIALAQDPTTALFPSMPHSACAYVAIDDCLPAAQLGARVAELVALPIDSPKGVFPVPSNMELEGKIAGLDQTVLDDNQAVGALTSLSCPECRGPMWEIHDGQLLRFRCRVGHAYTAETMVEGQAESIETTLWMAINSLTESAMLYTTLADSAHTHGDRSAAEMYEGKASTLHRRAQAIREMVMPGDAPARTEPGEDEAEVEAV